MVFVYFVFKHLERNVKKSIFLISVFAFLVFLLSSLIFSLSSLKNELNILATSFPNLSIQKIEGGRLVAIPENYTDSIAKITGVRACYTRTWGYIADDITGAVMTIMAQDSTNYGEIKTEISTLDSTEVLVGSGYLALKKLEIGDFITLRNSSKTPISLKIKGIFENELDLLTRDLILVNKKNAQNLLGLTDGFATDIVVQIHNENETDNIARKISDKISGLRINTQAQLRATYLNVFSERGTLFLSGIFIIGAAFVVLLLDKLSNFSNKEREEIALLKALGWSISWILRLKLFEALLVALLATFLGIIFSMVHLLYFDAFLLKKLLSGSSVILPNFNINFQFALTDILLIFSASILPYLAATLMPAWKLSMTEPEELLH